MIAIVCGGRYYTLTSSDCRLLSGLGISAVYTGGAPGADSQAEAWAAGARVRAVRYEANWTEHGKAAGPIRNAAMLRTALEDAAEQREVLIVVAFPGGRGTADMTRKARAAGVPVLRVRELDTSGAG